MQTHQHRDGGPVLNHAKRTNFNDKNCSTPEDESVGSAVPVPRCVIGDVFHSAAANETPDVKRWGLNVDYCPAFITEEEIESEHLAPPLQSTVFFLPFQKCVGKYRPPLCQRDWVRLTWVTFRSVLGAMSGEKQGNIGPRLRPDIQRLCGYDLFGPNLGEKCHDRIRWWEDSPALSSSRIYHLMICRLLLRIDVQSVLD